MNPTVTPEQAAVMRAMVESKDGVFCEDCQCCEKFRQTCETCGGAGDVEAVDDDDGCEYFVDCHICEGDGGWWTCGCKWDRTAP